MTGWCGFEQIVGVDSEVTRLPAECGNYRSSLSESVDTVAPVHIRAAMEE